MDRLEHQFALDANVAVSAARYRRLFRFGADSELESSISRLAGWFEMPSGSTRDAVIRRLWRWRIANAQDDATLRTLVFSKAGDAHGLGSVAMVPEVRTGTSIVDCAVLVRGAEQAVEIKSGRDSASRLHQQVADYLACFPQVTLIGDQVSEGRLIKVAAEYGLGLLVAKRVHGRSEFVEVLVGSRSIGALDRKHLLGMLRIDELRALGKHLGLETGHVAQTKLFDVSLEELAAVPVERVADGVYAALLARRKLPTSAIVRSVPLPLRASIASINPDRDKVVLLREWLGGEA